MTVTTGPLRVASTIGLLAAFAACGGSETPATGFLEQFVGGLCAKVHACRDAYDDSWSDEDDEFKELLEFKGLFGDSEAQCNDLLYEDIEAEDVAASVEAGRIAYDDAAAEDCLDWYEAAFAAKTCGEFWDWTVIPPQSCQRAFTGLVANGQYCAIPADCADDRASCGPDDEGDATCEVAD
jgi:hypothetical protein